jgi:hypothetical protein
MEAIDAMRNAHALVIGIANYQHVRKLPETVLKDARDIGALLVDPNFCAYPKDNVTLLLDGDATRENMRAQLQALAGRTNENSTVFFYLSSHGHHIASGPYAGEYILPVDTAYPGDAQVAQSAVSGGEFSDALKAFPARKVLVVLDCCHAQGVAALKGEGDEEPEEPEFKALPEAYYDTLNRGVGRAILASSNSSQRSYILPEATNSLFTQHLLDGLKGGATGGGGVIRVTDLFDYVAPLVRRDKPNQTPIFKAEFEENFPVALYQGGKGPEPATAEPLTDGFKYDVYVSYFEKDPADRTWVRQKLVPRLKAGGLSVMWDGSLDWRIGWPKIDNITNAVESSRYTLLVLSPGYVASAWDQYDSKVAESLGIELAQNRFMPLMRQACEPRLGIRMRDMLDMSMDEEFDWNMERVVYQLRQPPTA